MELPINERELNTIINALLLGGDTALYQKLWIFKMDYVSKKQKTKNGK